MRTTTVGQLLLDKYIPTDLREPGQVLDKKGINTLFKNMVDKHPDKYRELARDLSLLGAEIARREGGGSFGLSDTGPSNAVKAGRIRIRKALGQILSNSRLTPKARNLAILKLMSDEQLAITDGTVKELVDADNPLAMLVTSGARGNKPQLMRLVAGDFVYADHRDNPIPVPIMRSYSEGLTPSDYWAASYGGRRGLVSVKLGTGESGYTSKLLSQITHRLLVTDIDSDKEPVPGELRGLPVEVDDEDNIGALLAVSAGGLPRNTVITSKILQDLKKAGIKNILVRSPVVGGAPDGGLYARDVGYREFNRLADIGSMPGLVAAQSLGERLAQTSVGSKHRGGLSGGKPDVTSGFAVLDRMLNVPKTFKDGAAHAHVDGRIKAIEPNPLGGWHIYIGEQQHFVAPGFDPTVKVGDVVEAGDMLSDGVPNPAEFVKYKGIGDGSALFVKYFTKAFRDTGLPASRRNVELVAKGLIDHVEMDEEYGDWLPGDVAHYSAIEQRWEPRSGAVPYLLKDATDKYLEKPILHYTIGTKLRPSVIKRLQEFGVKSVIAHNEPPPFTPRMIRAASNLQHDPNWMVRLLGANQQKGILEAVRRAHTAPAYDTSYVPAKAEGIEFGEKWPYSILKQPK